MVNQCSIKSCKESKSKKTSQNLKMHSIPKSLARKEKWITAIRQHQPEFINVKASSKICSLHFLDSDYNPCSTKNQRILKKTAVPSIFMNRSNTIENIKADKDDMIDDTASPSSSSSSMSSVFSYLTAPNSTTHTPIFEEHLPGDSALDFTLQSTKNCTTKVDNANVKCPPHVVKLTPYQLKKRMYFIGDFKHEDDLNNPTNRKNLFHAFKRTSKGYISTIRKLRKENHNLHQKVLDLEQMVNHFQKQNDINQHFFNV